MSTSKERSDHDPSIPLQDDTLATAPETVIAPLSGGESVDIPPVEAQSVTDDMETADAVLETEVQKHIGRCLKEAYDELVTQPVPDRFVELLKELEAKSGSSKSVK